MIFISSTSLSKIRCTAGTCHSLHIKFAEKQPAGGAQRDTGVLGPADICWPASWSCIVSAWRPEASAVLEGLVWRGRIYGFRWSSAPWRFYNVHTLLHQSTNSVVNRTVWRTQIWRDKFQCFLLKDDFTSIEWRQNASFPSQLFKSK